MEVPVELIQPGRYQPRRAFPESQLQELASSIRAQGVIQPVVVRPTAEGRYELIAGERRWRASQLAGLSEIPAVVREVDEQSAMAVGLIENVQRADLNPLEEARALQRLLDEFGLTHQQVADAIGKSRTAVSNLVRLNDLCDAVKELVVSGRLEMGHARALLGVLDDDQAQLGMKVADEGLSVRQTERLVKQFQQRADQSAESLAAATEQADDPDIDRLVRSLGDYLGANVDINHSRKGTGKVVIRYNSLDELDGILSKVGVNQDEA